jgi:hypothetical protein
MFSHECFLSLHHVINLLLQACNLGLLPCLVFLLLPCFFLTLAHRYHQIIQGDQCPFLWWSFWSINLYFSLCLSNFQQCWSTNILPLDEVICLYLSCAMWSCIRNIASLSIFIERKTTNLQKQSAKHKKTHIVINRTTAWRCNSHLLQTSTSTATTWLDHILTALE